MKRFAILAMALLVASSITFAQDTKAPAPYDSKVVKAAMMTLMMQTGKIRSSLAAKDYGAAGLAFAEVSKVAVAMQGMVPKKGKPEDWLTLWKDFDGHAQAGITASGKSDATGSKTAYDAIMKLQMTGHSTFR